MQERTEDQMLSREPLKLLLAGKEHQIPILSRRKARAWREQLAEKMKEMGTVGVSLSAMGTAFVAFPDKVAELVGAYSPEKITNEVLEDSTDEELLLAFSAMVSVSFPFARLLSLMKQISQATPSLSASAKSTSFSSPSTDSARPN